MTQSVRAYLGAAAALVFAACSVPSESDVLGGLPCQDGACASGFYCDATNHCIAGSAPLSSGGSANATGGSSGSSSGGAGGIVASGGFQSTGGTLGAGGLIVTGGASSGGASGSGGVTASGGFPDTGGTLGSGGSNTGGTSSGGTSATGGVTSNGGASGSGGVTSTGGTTGAGGLTAGTGAATSTGGDASVDAGQDASSNDSGTPDAAFDAGPPPRCDDHRQNGEETAVDCGGPTCAPCGPGKGCLVEFDCASMNCAGTDGGLAPGVCVAASCTDHIKNGSETDVDCGGSCGACPKGGHCTVDKDCGANRCVTSVCAPASCANGTRNSGETDVDCGGSNCPPCTPGLLCAKSTDCTSLDCNTAFGRCVVPFCTDKVKNGTETDVDCGGSCTTHCANGKACAVDKDCQSGNCAREFATHVCEP